MLYLYFLGPFTMYTVYITPRGKNINGESSEIIKQYTDVDGPGPPIIMNATCIPGSSGTSIFLQWSQPEQFYKSVDKYTISLKKESDYIMDMELILSNSSSNLSVCKLLLFKCKLTHYLNLDFVVNYKLLKY